MITLGSERLSKYGLFTWNIIPFTSPTHIPRSFVINVDE